MQIILPKIHTTYYIIVTLIKFVDVDRFARQAALSMKKKNVPIFENANFNPSFMSA